MVISQVVHWNDPNARSFATTSCCNIVSLKSANLQGSSCSSRMIGWNEIYIKVRWSVLNPSYCTKKNTYGNNGNPKINENYHHWGFWTWDTPSGMMVPGYPIGLWKNRTRFPFDWAIWGLFGGIPYGPMVCQGLPKVAMESQKFLVMASSSIVLGAVRLPDSTPHFSQLVI